MKKLVELNMQNEARQESWSGNEVQTNSGLFLMSIDKR